MKKFIAIIAAIALIATMSVAAFAADTTIYCDLSDAVKGIHNDDTKEVYLNLVGDVTHVVCVDVTWDAFHYEYTGAVEWDPHNLEYNAAQKTDNSDLFQAKDGADNKIAYVNKSDVEVVITPTYKTSETAKNDVIITFPAEATKTLAAVDTTNAGTTDVTINECDTAEFVVEASWLSGNPSVTQTDAEILIGTITLTITTDPMVTARA